MKKIALRAVLVPILVVFALSVAPMVVNARQCFTKEHNYMSYRGWCRLTCYRTTGQMRSLSDFSCPTDCQ